MEKTEVLERQQGGAGDGAVHARRVRGARPARGAAAAPPGRTERDPDRRRDRERRVHPLSVHRLPGRPRVPVGRGRRDPGAVLRQHGDRALHARHRRDRARRLHAHVEGLGRGPRDRRPPRHRVARLGHRGRDGRDVRGRRRRPQRDRDRRPGRHRRHPDRVPGRVPDGREAEFIKIGAVLVFVVVALVAGISATAYKDTSQLATSFGTFPSEIPIAILVGALAAAGAGGANNLVQSNWIRDKGFGMGKYVPRITSPVTGQEEAAPSSERLSFPQDEANLGRWKVWWKRANLEQFVSFVCIGGLSIIVFSLVAYSTVYKNPDLPDSSGFDFIALESQVLDDKVGQWFGTLFLVGRRRQPVRGRAGDRGLRVAPGRRRPLCRVHARARRLEREPDLLRRGLDAGHLRQRDPALRLRPAADPAHDLDGPGRRADADLHVPAAGHQPPLPQRAGGAQRLSDRRCCCSPSCCSGSPRRSSGSIRSSSCSDGAAPALKLARSRSDDAH